MDIINKVLKTNYGKENWVQFDDGTWLEFEEVDLSDYDKLME